ncbi:Signal transduction histidine kinase [Lachnospiraceae bacterium NE2001]|nr:Signal transduction histidine kinase [Lachnospiraceae bacterium NE2001]
MNRLIDKIILFALSVYTMSLLIDGTGFLVFIYVSIICAALNYYLLSDEKADYTMRFSSVKEKLAFISQILLVIAVFRFSPLIATIPLIMYDITKSRNYIALTASVMAIIAYYSYPVGFLVIVFSILAIVLSIKSEKVAIYYRDLKKIRDDSEETNSRLRSQNTELMNARDTEVYNAQLSERNRIAREIHDNVGHTLSRAILQMGALLAIHKEEPIHTELEGVRETLDSAMNSIRSSVHDLHDDSIDVKASIAEMVRPLNDKYNVRMDLDIASDTPRPVKYAIIGITKECISNIIKHSKNSDVDIKLNEHPSMYQLIIHDYNPVNSDNSINSNTNRIDSSKYKTNNINGNDINSDKAGNYNPESNFKDFGMGLENIRGRVESVNGTLNISTENGFRVFVSIPRN